MNKLVKISKLTKCYNSLIIYTLTQIKLKYILINEIWVQEGFIIYSDLI